MTRRGLVALGAVRGRRRRVAEPGDGPAVGHMALGATRPEQALVPVLRGMAAPTIEARFEWRRPDSGRVRALDLDPPEQSVVGRPGLSLRLPQADVGEGRVVHLRRRRCGPPVLRVTLAAARNGRVEGRRLAGE